MNTRLHLIILFSLLFFVSQSVSAQYSVFNHLENEKYIELYVAKPTIKDELADFNRLSHTGVISSQFFCKSDYCLIAELPYSYSNYETTSDFSNKNINESNFVIGNPRFGIRNFLSEQYQLDISLVLPNVSIDEDFISAYYGMLTRSDELEMFAPKLTSLSIDGLVNFSSNNMIQPYIKIGMTGWKLESSFEDTEYELLNKYDVGLVFSPKDFLLTAKVKGITILTESDLDFDKRNVNSFILALKLKSKYQPGIYFLKPLDAQQDSVKYTIGIGIGSTF